MCIHVFQAIVEKVSRFSQTREKQDEKGRKIRGFCFGNIQDSEDWPASYVATYPSRSLMCVRGYHVVFSYLITRRRLDTPINMKGHFIKHTINLIYKSFTFSAPVTL